jgi:hypothetical protein
MMMMTTTTMMMTMTTMPVRGRVTMGAGGVQAAVA